MARNSGIQRGKNGFQLLQKKPLGSLSFTYSFRRMSTERSVDNASRRYDLLTFDQFGAPHLLIECKSPETQLKIEHIVQLGTYNDSLNASYALLTNGIDSLLINISTGEFLETLSDCFGTNS
jgi:hypothetical protein